MTIKLIRRPVITVVGTRIETMQLYEIGDPIYPVVDGHVTSRMPRDGLDDDDIAR